MNIIQKYGGACLATPEKIRIVAQRLAERHRQGHKIVAVVSAMGQSTDSLIRLAYDVSPNPNRRELDMLLSTGERVSMSLMSMALADLGIPAISFTGSQAGVLTDSSHSSARIVDVKPIRVREELDRGRVVVLAGFQGVHPATKEITTLGRGGSDTTAVAMAAALNADRCEIIKEVDGVCSADPRVYSAARPLRQVEFCELAEMCFWGAKVLHYRSVELASQLKVPLTIHNWNNVNEFTQVCQEVMNMEIGKVLAINSLARVEHLHIKSTSLDAGLVFLQNHLKTHQLAWPQILASAFDAAKGVCRVALTGDNETLDVLMRSLGAGSDIQPGQPKMAAVTLTSHGGPRPELLPEMLTLLGQHKIATDKCLVSSRSITAFIPFDRREEAVRLLGQKFLGA